MLQLTRRWLSDVSIGIVQRLAPQREQAQCAPHLALELLCSAKLASCFRADYLRADESEPAVFSALSDPILQFWWRASLSSCSGYGAAASGGSCSNTSPGPRTRRTWHTLCARNRSR